MPKPHHAFATVLALLLAGCASSSGGGSQGAGESMRVLLRGYQAGQRFELASQSHTDRVEYYSAVRSDASLKVQTDEVMFALVEELEQQGFEDYAQAGRAPTQVAKHFTWGIEIERGGQMHYWAVGQGSEADERIEFHECMNTFVQIYNLTASYQTVENDGGGDLFEKAQVRRSGT